MRKKWYFYFDQKGFSLAEILMTLVIVGLLTVIGIPHYQKSQRKGMQTEAKVLLSGLYAKERAFVDEWGYGTPNFHQLGFFPRGNYFYNAGWETSHISATSDINEVNGSGTVTKYEGPYLPSDLNRPSLSYNDLGLSPPALKNFTNVKEVCKDSNFKDESPCTFNPTATSNFDIPPTFGSYEIEINNKSDPDAAAVKFGIGATARFTGSSHNDNWYINENGRLKNVQIGL